MAPQPEMLEMQGVSLRTRHFRHPAEVVRCRASRHLFYQQVPPSGKHFPLSLSDQSRRRWLVERLRRLFSNGLRRPRMVFSTSF